MGDIVSTALRSVATHAPYAPAIVFGAGAVTSFGPCAAPRFIAVASFARSAGTLVGVAFALGLAAGYALVGTVVGAFELLAGASSTTFALLGTAMLVGGCIQLTRAGESGAECCRADPRDPHPAGEVFLIGAASAFTIAPCCTPVLAAIAAYTTSYGDYAAGAVLLAAFALGHGLPAIFFGASVGRLSTLRRARMLRQPIAIVGSSLAIILGFYYGLLA